eukprot:Blabericola_migrator_1__2108@NODE_1580_length_4237_cov_221_241487_g1032_i0_p1_GENE_NODE_1580_length_4237_cov_221_241487_g1032_i0NODE_1580_length_4237_cov_221_241487_g1032_i0_p1_ORF_typecomplete_len318_score65_90Hydrolase_3/PF08282_12/5e28HAD/PF12710_7/2_2e03HAD/PF12710_7/8_5e02HAD/PF12710_7/4e05S6PP/PF05116_13/16S6PP/PF05116_13/4_3e03S6PP/PF05116_13/0_14Trehalose_PPase/PF02358_16/0_0023Hydrolase_6/PF13344_6/0_018Hydrolase_6/PF13344_6/2_9e03Hydrolase/PF00702_26/11Hydrolase/PF00702_26/46_NODE_1580
MNLLEPHIGQYTHWARGCECGIYKCVGVCVCVWGGVCVDESNFSQTKFLMVLEQCEKPTWLATDMDGTFFNSHHGVEETTIEAYKKLRHNGVPVIPCTGRSLKSTQLILGTRCSGVNVTLTPGVYLNGNIVYGDSEDDIIYCKCLPTPALQTFLEAYYKLVGTQTDLSVMFLQGPMPSVIDYQPPFWPGYATQWCEEDPDIYPKKPLTEYIKEVPFYRCCQATIIGLESEINRLQNLLMADQTLATQLSQHNIKLLRATHMVLTAMITTENKAKALGQLVRRYPQLDFKNALCIGDGNNDLEMLRCVSMSGGVWVCQ